MAYKNKEDQARYHKEVWYPKNKARRLELNKAWRIKQKILYQKYKERLQCEVCGESTACCLDFHHKDPNKKYKAIALMREVSFKKRMKEISKCVVLCANCHRKVHAGIVQLEEYGLCTPETVEHNHLPAPI